jgi:hypothetical protein
MRSREANRPTRGYTNPPLFQWDVFLEVFEEHWFAWLLVISALLLLWKEYSLFWAPHGW